MEIGALMAFPPGTSRVNVTLNPEANGRRDVQFVATRLTRLEHAVKVETWYGETAAAALKQVPDRQTVRASTQAGRERN